MAFGAPARRLSKGSECCIDSDFTYEGVENVAFVRAPARHLQESWVSGFRLAFRGRSAARILDASVFEYENSPPLKD